MNRLAHATSPYLLQHASNPVEWYEWGTEALARARTEQKPILLSIGYSACHWCHVMAHESFEDPATAAIMNAHFVNIKVDREERPDLDDIYMAATQAMNHGQGGWPMTVFLTPAQEPFFAGTYFPPGDRHGRPGFPTLLRRIAELWAGKRETLVAQAGQLTSLIRESSVAAPGGVQVPVALRQALARWERTFDPTWGGFGGAPKFPAAQSLRVLLRARRDGSALPDPSARRMVTTTLAAMAQGGIQDHLGGGFARYSTDDRWLVPHFEKMLYDNALLAVAYLEGWQATARPLYRQVAERTLDYVLREMTAPGGGFWSATDADSEGEEGRYFVWSEEEVREVVGSADAPLVLAWFGVRAQGNWEGHNILHTPEPLDRVAARLGIDARDAAARIEAARAALLSRRNTRVPPALDDKVLTAWNGLMIAALATGARVLGEPRYRIAAEHAAAFLRDNLGAPDGGLFRSWRRGTARLDGYLEDYAFLADGLVSLYEAGGDEQWLHEARRLVQLVSERFAAPDGGYYATSSGHEALIARPRDGHDDATPSANAVAALVMARLSYHCNEPALRDAARHAIEAFGAMLTEHPTGFATSLLALDLLEQGPVELALLGAPDDPRTIALANALSARFIPHAIHARHDPARGRATLPLLAGKELVGGQPALFVCRDYACQRPVTDPSGVAALLDA